MLNKVHVLNFPDATSPKNFSRIHGVERTLEIKSTIEERMLRATIDLAILKILTNQAMTGYAIVRYFTKKMGITSTNSMVYNSLASMERKGWIKCISNQRARVYTATDQGKEIVAKLPDVYEEIQRYAKLLLG